jgi:hypothetical protein
LFNVGWESNLIKVDSKGQSFKSVLFILNDEILGFNISEIGRCELISIVDVTDFKVLSCRGLEEMVEKVIFGLIFSSDIALDLLSNSGVDFNRLPFEFV